MSFELKLLEPPESAEESCYIENAAGVAAVLRRIAADGSRAAAYLDDGETFVHTALLGVERDPDAVYFEKCRDVVLNARLLQSAHVTFVTSDQGVPVQFSCPEPRLGEHEGAEAFQIEMPERVLRLQRRNYYRLPGEPVHAQLSCELVCGDEVENAVLKPHVIDLSCGGLAAAVPLDTPTLESDTRAQCSIELPGLGKVASPVRVRAISEMVMPDGRSVRRYGLEFLDLGNRYVSMVERFIFDQQRQRKKVGSL